MATKNFCDLCGEPAMQTAFTHIKVGERSLNRLGYHICVEFIEAKEYYPMATDERKDCCAKCLADGLERIVERLRKCQD